MLRAVAVALVVFGGALPAVSQVDCSTPDDLCTGDPCVISSLDVLAPCVVDFGTRAVVVAGKIGLPGNGSALPFVSTLYFTAGSITVQGSIECPPNEDIGDVVFSAAGMITIDGPINLSGCAGGFVDLMSGSDINVNSRITLNSRGGTAAATLTANRDIHVRDRIRGLWGCYVVSADGDVEIADTGAILGPALVRDGDGCNLSIDAGGRLTSAGRLSMRGNSTSGDITLIGGEGVELHGTIDLRASPRFGNGGFLEVQSPGGEVVMDAAIRAKAFSAAYVTIGASGDLTISRRINGDGGRDGHGSRVNLSSATGDVVIDGVISARVGRLLVPAVTIDAGNEVVVNRRILVNDPRASESYGGTIRLDGDSVRVGSRVLLNADGRTRGGQIRLLATAGNLDLGGLYLARGGSGPGGVIEGTASGNITTDGVFQCAGTPAGCIALNAGGTLDTTGAMFDKPLSGDCPGSPSGAFLVPTAAALD